MQAIRHHANSRKTKADRIFDAVNLAFWIVVLLLTLYPLWLIIIASLSDPDAVLSGKVLFWPVDVSLIGYEAVFRHKVLWQSYANALYYTLAGTTLSITVTMMGAYALSQKFTGKKLINFLIVFTMFFSGGLIPIFLTMRDLGLYDTRAILILINGVSVWNLMVARTYMQSTLPKELYEAAVIDGANHFSYFARIVLPLSGTIIAVLAVYYGVAKWNDYFSALVFIRDRGKLPLQTILREIIASLTTSTSSEAFFSAYADDIKGMTDAVRQAAVAKYCTIVVSTGPAIALYIFMQKYFVKGIMIGSLKG